MKMPRFSYQVPEDLTEVFKKEMEKQFRESPSNLITAILRHYFNRPPTPKFAKVPRRKEVGK